MRLTTPILSRFFSRFFATVALALVAYGCSGAPLEPTGPDGRRARFDVAEADSGIAADSATAPGDDAYAFADSAAATDSGASGDTGAPADTAAAGADSTYADYPYADYPYADYPDADYPAEPWEPPSNGYIIAY